jgi:hypothetical protein
MLGGKSIPDSAEPFTNYRDAADAKSSDERLSITGRKNATFAMLRVQNLTASWAAVLRDKKPVVPLSGTVTLNGMAEGVYTVRWLDTRSGRTLNSARASAKSGSLPLTVTGLTADIAAIIVRQ